VDYEGPCRTILVVDDVAANREVSTAALALGGFRTLEAANGQEAIEQIRTHSPDLVIMDVLMPVMDGLEAIQAIRCTPAFEALPVIAVSASNYQSDRRQALEAGANAFLSKPLDFGQLFEQVGELLQLTWKHRE
jgi:CheY-like chemotaxis protein